jgi:tetratricopeptide (TPR) repeat protein
MIPSDRRLDRRRGSKAGHILPILLFILLAVAVPVSLRAVESDNTSAKHGNPGDFDKKLERLRTAYQLFPLNEKLKRNLAEAYANYGNLLFSQRQYEQADVNYLKASELYPDETAFALSRGICNYYLKKYEIARYELERTLPNNPDSADLLFYLGLVLYETDDRKRAIELWERALKQSPGRTELINVLDKARRETAVEESMDRGHSSRFNLTYDPGVNTSFALAILDVLESASNQVGAELGHFPEARVPVAIYKQADYKNVTNSPDWSSGAYDGTIRLPFGSMSEINPAMRSILFHEYAHVVVFDLTRGNCPLWLNEGIAEMFGRRQFTHPAVEGGPTAPKGTFIDIRRLEGSFTDLSSNDIALAYQQSYSLVNYLVTAYGWHRVKAILEGLGKGMTTAAAIAAALQDYSIGYDGLVKEWRESLQQPAANR